MGWQQPTGVPWRPRPTGCCSFTCQPDTLPTYPSSSSAPLSRRQLSWASGSFTRSCARANQLRPGRPAAIYCGASQGADYFSVFGLTRVQGSCHRLVAEMLVQEIGRRPGPSCSPSLPSNGLGGASQDREGYALAAGMALGLVTLGKGRGATGLTGEPKQIPLFKFQIPYSLMLLRRSLPILTLSFSFSFPR